MAQYYIVSKDSIDASADAIRSKTGSQSAIEWDGNEGFADAIDAISGGGITPTGTKQISITQNGTTTEDVTNYASAEITVNVSGGGVKRDTIQQTVASQGSTLTVPTVATNPSKILFVTFYVENLTYPTNTQVYMGMIMGPQSLKYGDSNYWACFRTNSTGTSNWALIGGDGTYTNAGYIEIAAPPSQPFKVGESVKVDVYYTD